MGVCGMSRRLTQDLLPNGTLGDGARKGSVHGPCRVSSHIWHVGFQTWIHSPVWNVCVTLTRAFTCAPRWGVALVDFVSTGCVSSPCRGTPLSGIGHTQVDGAP